MGETNQAAFADMFAGLADAWTIDEEAAKRHEAERERERRRENLRKLEGIITDADIERIVWDRLDTFAANVVRRFLAASRAPDGPRFAWLTGEIGRGKTVAACLVIAMERGRYVSADEVWLAYSARTSEASRLRDYMRRCRLLVVDDVGTSRDDAQNALFQLVNARQGKRRLTIITGNASRDAVRRWLDPRTLSRIEHQGAIVDCRGPNMRRGGES